LCDANQIQLLLVSTPYVETDSARHAAMAEAAKAEGLVFLDFNTRAILDEMAFDFARDMADGGHANTSGAVKMTGFIGNVLAASGIEGTKDDQYELSREYVMRQIKNANLYRIQTLHEFLSAILYENYLIFVTGSAGTDALLREEGFEITARGAYGAVKKEGWEVSDAMLRGSDFGLNISWKVMPGEESAAIEVYGTAYERKQPGIEIVLLDREKGYVMDHSCFDEAGNRVQ
jgi:hypothetical protein